MRAYRLSTLSSLLAVSAALAAGAFAATAPTAAAAAADPTVATLSAATTARPAASPLLVTFWPDYDAARTALANDRLGDLARPAKELLRTIAAVDAAQLTAESAAVPANKVGAVRELLPDLRKASQALSAAASLPDARKAFGDLSKDLVTWRKLAAAGPDVGFCPMVGKEWLQPAGKPVENPYGGRAMATCGEVAPPHA